MLKKRLLFFIICIYFAGFVRQGYTQELYLIKEWDVDKLSDIPIARLFNKDRDAFAIARLSQMRSQDISFSQLDAEPENMVFFWVERMDGNPLDSKALPVDEYTQVVWRTNKGALVRSESYFYLKKLPFQFSARQLHFAKGKKRFKKNPRALRKISQSQSIAAVLDSVRWQRLLSTLKHISGVESYWLDGKKDSIMTRYASGVNPDMEKVRAYFRNQFESFGYNVENQSFRKMAKAVSYSSDKRDNGWAIVDHQIYYTNNGGASWTCQYEEPNGLALNRIFAVDGQTVWVKGNHGLLLKTTTGGQDWIVLPSSTQHPFDFQKETFLKKGVGDAIHMSIPVGGFQNIIVTKKGITYPNKYYIIGGHYDSTSEMPSIRAPGADDNGTGACTVLEAARVLALYDFQYSIKFILFDNEEGGLHGSYAYAKEAAQRGEDIVGMINLDMIGYDSDGNGVFEIHSGWELKAQLMGQDFMNNANNWSLSMTPHHWINQFSSSRSDHSSFWTWGYPAILIIEDTTNDFNWLHYHSTHDLIDFMNFPYYYHLSQVTIGTLASLAIIENGQTAVTDFTNPKSFKLLDPYPNPFNSQIHFEMVLPENDHVKVSIYNLMGQQVRELVNENMLQGDYHLSWDGKTHQNKDCSSGVYFIRLEAQNQFHLKKVILVR